MSDKDQELKNNEGDSSGVPTHLTKEEMRKKIKAALAAKEALEPEAPQQHAPAYAATAPASKSGTSPIQSNDRARAEKMRQIRDAVSASHTSSDVGARPNNNPQSVYDRPSHTAPPRSGETPRHPAGTSYNAFPRKTAETMVQADGSRIQRIWIIIAITVAAVLLLVYFAGVAIYHGKFLPHTVVNGVDISGMTGDEAQQAILQSATEESLTFIPREGDPIVFKGASFGCTVAIPDGALTVVAEESHALWFKKLFSPSTYTIQLEESYSEDALVSLIAAYEWGTTPPTDAQVVSNGDGTYSIQPEDDGNMVDTEILSDYTVAQMREGNTTIRMEDCDCYKKASVTAASLEGTLELYNRLGSVQITYDMTDREEMLDPVGTETIDHETLMEWITPADGDITVDTDKASAWIQEHIADKYDSFVPGYTRTFESTMDGTVTVPLSPTSIYGWKTDVDATVEKLVEHIKEGGEMTIEPVYSQEGFRMNSNSGVTYTDDTYIEVDICHQKLWFYIDGELYLETDVVTGLASDPSRITNPGVFKIRDRIKGKYLGTYEVQGYHTWVDYWMPIDHTGIGLHDLSRSAYGGEIYKTNGSHGCINLPKDIAAQIFEKTTVGMPVIIVP